MQIVRAMHFICRDSAHVITCSDGVFQTKYWKVAAKQARSVRVVALHEAKNLPSYRQGEVIGVTEVEYDGKIRYAFKVRPLSKSLAWQGKGTGEKGYGYESGDQ